MNRVQIRHIIYSNRSILCKYLNLIDIYNLSLVLRAKVIVNFKQFNFPTSILLSPQTINSARMLDEILRYAVRQYGSFENCRVNINAVNNDIFKIMFKYAENSGNVILKMLSVYNLDLTEKNLKKLIAKSGNWELLEGKISRFSNYNYLNYALQKKSRIFNDPRSQGFMRFKIENPNSDHNYFYGMFAGWLFLVWLFVGLMDSQNPQVFVFFLVGLYRLTFRVILYEPLVHFDKLLFQNRILLVNGPLDIFDKLKYSFNVVKYAITCLLLAFLLIPYYLAKALYKHLLKKTVSTPLIKQYFDDLATILLFLGLELYIFNLEDRSLENNF